MAISVAAIMYTQLLSIRPMPMAVLVTSDNENKNPVNEKSSITTAAVTIFLAEYF